MPTTRETIQSRLVLDALKSLQNHPTVEELYEQIRQQHPTISKATVYRNLQKLEEQGKLRQLHLPQSPSRFDDIKTPHYHFHCRICSSICDAPLAYQDALDQLPKTGFCVEGHNIIFYGLCESCQKQRALWQQPTL